MKELTIKLAAFESLYAQKDPYAALTDCHKDWVRNNELTQQLCIIKQEILALGGKQELDAIVEKFKQKQEESERRLEEFNRKHLIKLMYIEYEHQYGWNDLDEQDKRFEKSYGDLWIEHRDEIWEKVCPKHRSKKYAEHAIADSKLPEVCHD